MSEIKKLEKEIETLQKKLNKLKENRYENLLAKLPEDAHIFQKTLAWYLFAEHDETNWIPEYDDRTKYEFISDDGDTYKTTVHDYLLDDLNRYQTYYIDGLWLEEFVFNILDSAEYSIEDVTEEFILNEEIIDKCINIFKEEFENKYELVCACLEEIVNANTIEFVYDW